VTTVQTIDVGSTLDNAPWTAYQKLLIAATASTIIFDGLDNQLLNAALPTLMREWNLPRPAFVPAQTAGMIGMMIGGALGGVAGDRLGRRIALLGSVVAFGLLTMLVPLASGVGTLTVLRFFAGFGLGGAMPNAAALSSELVPKRKRPFAVTLTLVCIPLGGSLAGLIGGWVLPRFGWRALFFVGGVLPLLLVAALVKLLPESPRFLARLPERWPQLRAQLRRLGHQVSDDARFADVTEQAVAKVSARELLVPAYRRDTLALSASYFFCLLAVYMGVTWVPAVLTGGGFDVGTASYGLTAFNLGGVVGAILGAILIMRLGSRLTMLVMTAGVVLGAGVLATMSISPASSAMVFAMLAWTGGLNNAVQTTMYALAAHVYPTAVRATGVGTAVAVGRIGGVLSPSFGSWALETGGSPRYFGLISATMALTFVALASIRRHIPGASFSQAAAR
jgi:MFS transporter, AAHS family, 4-hydroxybenzoate transporter